MDIETSTHAIGIPYILEITAFLLGVVVIVPLFKKLRLSPVLGFLAVGAVIGPHALGVIKDIEGVQHFAELGVIFLLFTIGLELSFERLRTFSGLIFGLGCAQVLSCAIAIGAIAYLWGNSSQSSIIIGLCLSLSSTAMVMQVLNERGEMATKRGRSSFSILLFQDLAVVPILILLSVFGKGQDSSILVHVLYALLNAVLVIVAIVILGRFGLRKLFEIAAHTRSIDVFTAMTLLVILAISIATGLAGLSMALGAFLAGLLLAETEFRHQIEGEIAPFKGLFLGLFFMSVGMNIDFVIAFENLTWVVLSIAGLIAIKTALTFAWTRIFKLSVMDGLRTSLLVAEAGEFAFVVIGQATLTYQIIEPDIGQFMVVVAGISMMLTPALAKLGDIIAEHFSQPEPHDAEDLLDEDIHDHVIIAGFGRVGEAVAEILESQAIPFIAIDSDAVTVKAQRNNQHTPVYVGDASRSEILNNSGIDRACALLLTMNSAEDALNTLNTARQLRPDLTIIVRSRDVTHSQALLDAGASQVVPETIEASLQLSNYVLRSAGYSKDEALGCIDSIRDLIFSEENIPQKPHH